MIKTYKIKTTANEVDTMVKEVYAHNLANAVALAVRGHFDNLYDPLNWHEQDFEQIAEAVGSGDKDWGEFTWEVLEVIPWTIN